MRIVTNIKLPNTVSVDAVDKFTSQDIFYYSDTIAPEYITDIIDQKGKPKYIVGDNAGSVSHSQLRIYTLPVRGIELEWLMLKDKCELSSNICETTHCFNFLINKKQVNRHILIKLIEYFKLTNYQYTWKGLDSKFDIENLMSEFDSDANNWPSEFGDLKTALAAPVGIKPNWIEFQQAKSVSDYGGNAWTWNNIFKDLVSSTAVSLISESQSMQKSSVFTEKTLYAIMGGTIPIWIGGYGHADYFKSIGFDTFDDYVNHDYQYEPTLIRRCFHAFYDNLKLLADINHAQSVRQRLWVRIMHNRELLYNDIFANHRREVLNLWPDDLAGPMASLWQDLIISFATRQARSELISSVDATTQLNHD